jgi:hypothetical protein
LKETAEHWQNLSSNHSKFSVIGYSWMTVNEDRVKDNCVIEAFCERKKMLNKME